MLYKKHLFFQDHKKIAFLDIVQRYFEIHATVGGALDKKTKVKYALPSYVHNHGVLKANEIQELLRETTVRYFLYFIHSFIQSFILFMEIFKIYQNQ